VRFAKKTLLEESHSHHNLIQLLQLLVRHPGVFYSSRGQFMSQMVNSLSRLGMPQNSTWENRKLAVDLAALLVTWEELRRERARGAGRDPLAGRHEQEAGAAAGHGGAAGAIWIRQRV
jgi:transformation/transcription domain-associated protein